MINQIKALIEKLPSEYAGPCIFYSEGVIRQNVLNLRSIVDKYKNISLLYSVKANMNNSVIECLDPYLDGYDVASWNEYLKVKRKNKRINATGYAFSSENIVELAINGCFDFVSYNQLLTTCKDLHDLRVGIRISGKKSKIELGTRDTSRFGAVYEYDCTGIKAFCDSNRIDINRLHIHLGEKSLEDIEEMIATIRQWLYEYETIEEINFGGGWDYLYENGMLDEALKRISKEFRDKKIYIEPGSLLIRKAGLLVTQVIDYRINSSGYGDVVLDSSRFNLSSWYTPKIIARFKCNGRIEVERYDICGNTCFEEDFFFKNQNKPIGLGDVLCLYPVGAYYNSTHRELHGIKFPKEVIL